MERVLGPGATIESLAAYSRGEITTLGSDEIRWLAQLTNPDPLLDHVLVLGRAIAEDPTDQESEIFRGEVIVDHQAANGIYILSRGE